MEWEWAENGGGRGKSMSTIIGQHQQDMNQLAWPVSESPPPPHDVSSSGNRLFRGAKGTGSAGWAHVLHGCGALLCAVALCRCAASR